MKQALKWLAVLALVPLLSGCVTYYYPATAQVDGVYYAADDPAYSGRSVDYVSVDYGAVGYYPWWSVDYFYLGYGYSSPGVSIGFSYSYPWRPAYVWRPYGYVSWYYDPWMYGFWYGGPYYPWPAYSYYHHPAYWHVHNRHHRDRYDYRHDRPGYRPYDDGRYAHGDRRGRDRDDYRMDEPDDSGHGHYRATGHGRDEIGSWDGNGRNQRRVTVSPDSTTTDRGMVIVSKDGGKWSRSRLEPVGNTEPARRVTTPVEPVHSETPGAYSTIRQGRTTIVRPSDAKTSRSRTTPTNGLVRVDKADAPVRGGVSVRSPGSMSAPVVTAPSRAPQTSRYQAPVRTKEPASSLGGRGSSSRSATTPAPRASRSAPSRSIASPSRSSRSSGKSISRSKTPRAPVKSNDDGSR